MLSSALALLPRGYALPDADWRRRHALLLWVLAVHVPLLAGFGVLLAVPSLLAALAAGVPALLAGLGWLLRRHRRWASVVVTTGLVYCSAALVVLTDGTIEAHFHFFVVIGFIALYQDWVPLLFDVGLTVLGHVVGSAWRPDLVFDHAAGQADPWLWSTVHGVAVLGACAGVVVFWRVTENQQRQRDALARELADTEIRQRGFVSDLLVNLARRNQSMLYRQMEIINQLEESEGDPDALAELFKLDHITTRVRRNAESLLVLAGEQPPRVWSEPVSLRDAVRAAIAETEDLRRVVYDVDESIAVAGHVVTDITHLLAELTENAVRSSPPDVPVTVRSREDRAEPGRQVLTVEDWGIGMPPAALAAANELLARPQEVDLTVHRRIGFHVVARLAARHRISVHLVPTPGSGVTAVVGLPPGLFDLSAAPLAPAVLGLPPEPALPAAPVLGGSFHGPIAPSAHRRTGRPAEHPLQRRPTRSGSHRAGRLAERADGTAQDRAPARDRGDRTPTDSGPWTDWPRLRGGSPGYRPPAHPPRPGSAADPAPGYPPQPEVGPPAASVVTPATSPEPATELHRQVLPTGPAPALRTPQDPPGQPVAAGAPAADAAPSRHGVGSRAVQDELGDEDRS